MIIITSNTLKIVLNKSIFIEKMKREGLDNFLGVDYFVDIGRIGFDLQESKISKKIGWIV